MHSIQAQVLLEVPMCIQGLRSTVLKNDSGSWLLMFLFLHCLHRLQGSLSHSQASGQWTTKQPLPESEQQASVLWGWQRKTPWSCQDIDGLQTREDLIQSLRPVALQLGADLNKKVHPRTRGQREQTAWQLFYEVCPHLLAEERLGPSLQKIKSPAPALFQRHLRQYHHQKHTVQGLSILLCGSWLEKGVRYMHPGHHLSDPFTWAWLCTPHTITQCLAQTCGVHIH